MRTIRFGIIGCGMMGREFASAAARWCHLTEIEARPEIVAVCNRSPGPFEWFRQNFPAIKQFTGDYRELLANPAIEALYIAVPHHLHREIFGAAIRAGKHVLGEKPFGIDLAANGGILAELNKHPTVFARCAAQFSFYPAAQRLCDLIERNAFGHIIEVNAGFLHSSDLDPKKRINWKRIVEFNGEYGCMGDLGMHICLVPFRAGWVPRNVRAILSDIIKERPDGEGHVVPCRTWDNATLFCEATDRASGDAFPMTLKMQRIAPGEKNTWYLEVLGTKASARFSTRDARRLNFLEYSGGEQIWGDVQTGQEAAFKTITGAIFEFGAPDAILQMWAAFVHELATGKPLKKFSACATPAETALSHRLFTAAIASHKNRAVVPVGLED
jgi:predicted dehydrogenase